MPSRCRGATLQGQRCRKTANRALRNGRYTRCLLHVTEELDWFQKNEDDSGNHSGEYSESSSSDSADGGVFVRRSVERGGGKLVLISPVAGSPARTRTPEPEKDYIAVMKSMTLNDPPRSRSGSRHSRSRAGSHRSRSRSRTPAEGTFSPSPSRDQTSAENQILQQTRLREESEALRMERHNLWRMASDDDVSQHLAGGLNMVARGVNLLTEKTGSHERTLQSHDTRLNLLDGGQGGGMLTENEYIVPKSPSSPLLPDENDFY